MPTLGSVPINWTMAVMQPGVEEQVGVDLHDDVARRRRERFVHRDGVALVVRVREAHHLPMRARAAAPCPRSARSIIVDEDHLRPVGNAASSDSKNAGRNATPLKIGTMTLTCGTVDNS